MNKILGIIAAVTLVAIAVFEIGKEGQEILGLGPVIILLIFGLIMWALLGSITNKRIDGPNATITSALWLHSIFEGALAALSFSFGFRAGLIVLATLFLHLLPESLAMIAGLKQSGVSSRQATMTYLISIGLLISSFGLFIVLPKVDESILVGLSTLVAGGFIYIAVNISRKVFQAN